MVLFMPNAIISNDFLSSASRRFANCSFLIAAIVAEIISESHVNGVGLVK